MVKIKYIIGAIIGVSAVILGVILATVYFQSEEKKVRKQFYLLSGWVSKESGESLFTMTHKTRNIGTLFDEKCGFKTYLDSLSGGYTPEEVSSYAARGRLQFSELNLKFYDITVAFPEKEMAKVSLTARVKGKLTTGEYVDETHEMACVLKKIEKKWLFINVEMVEVLKK